MKTQFLSGKVYRIYSERFGTNDVLIIKKPGKEYAEKRGAVPIMQDGSTSEMLFMDSIENDRIEREWDNLAMYFGEQLGANNQ